MEYDIYGFIVICIVVLFCVGMMSLVLISAKKNHEKEMKNVAFTDIITGLDNWEKFKCDVPVIIDNTDKKYAFVIFDIREFGKINEVYGTTEGDRLLARIAGIVREQLHNDERLARYHGDVFTALIECSSKSMVIERLEDIASMLSKCNSTFIIKVAFGVSVIEEENKDLLELFKQADLAKNRVKTEKVAKTDKTGNVAFFDKSMQENQEREMRIETIMESALERGEFLAYYQPQYNINSREIVGAEAYIRWDRRGKGIMHSIGFVPIFEKNGFIVKTDRFMIEYVCKQLREWLDKEIAVVPITINQSKLNINNEHYVNEVLGVLKKYNIPSELIGIEFTDSMYEFDRDVVVDTIRRLRIHGISVTMNLFELGDNILAAFERVPLDYIKIDRKYYNDLINSDRGRIIANNLINLGRELNMPVRAEGLETEGQIEFLREAGCETAQGYFFSVPLSSNRFEELLS